MLGCTEYPCVRIPVVGSNLITLAHEPSPFGLRTTEYLETPNVWSILSAFPLKGSWPPQDLSQMIDTTFRLFNLL